MNIEWNYKPVLVILAIMVYSYLLVNGIETY